MRLKEVERGDSLFSRLLIRTISLASGMRLPDAARIVFYHKTFYGEPMSAWTHAAMRGESSWTVGERELMAALTAKWNACAFCIGAHGAVAALALRQQTVENFLEEFQEAQLSAELRATLVFLEVLTRDPRKLTVEDARATLQSGVTSEALEDALAVSVLFNITGRCADALEFEVPGEDDLGRAAKRLLKQGYAFGSRGTPRHPNHRALAEALRQRVFQADGETSTALRRAMAERAAGGRPLEAPYDELARQIGEAAYKVTDDQVSSVVRAAGSEKGAFELVVASALGAGFLRWRRGLEVLNNANRATLLA